jgi:hypothetical protein
LNVIPLLCDLLGEGEGGKGRGGRGKEEGRDEGRRKVKRGVEAEEGGTTVAVLKFILDSCSACQCIDEYLMRALFTLDEVRGSDEVKKLRRELVARIKQLIAVVEKYKKRLKKQSTFFFVCSLDSLLAGSSLLRFIDFLSERCGEMKRTR